MKKPQDYSKRILLTIAGSSPAIVTETLYALSQQAEPFIPTEIHIITTSGVIQNIETRLLGTAEKVGAIEQLCHDYDFELPHIDSNTIHIITNGQGEQLSDIVSEADNEATANFIVNKVRELSLQEDTSLHVSIAGGRKTMTYYLGYAMSVFGRIQDEMSHVLVENDIRSDEFFYPPPKSTMLKDFNGNEFDASKVKIMLGYLPYIRLRDGLTQDLLQNKTISYGELIEIAQRQLAPLSVRYDQGKVYCGKYPIKLADADISLYLWILQRHIKGKTPITFNSREEKRHNTEEFLSIYQKQSNESEHFYKLKEDTFKENTPMDSKYFGEHRSKINKAIEEALGKPAAVHYLIESSGKRGAKRYTLPDNLKADSITLPNT